MEIKADEPNISDPLLKKLVSSIAAADHEGKGSVERDRVIGSNWLEVKKTSIKPTGLTVAAYAKKYLSKTPQFLDRCGQLDRLWPEYPAAESWYQQAGIAEGWQITRSTGVDRGLAVIKIYRKHLNGETPSSEKESREPKKSKSEQKAAELEKDREAARAWIKRLASALKTTVAIYRQTPQGEDYECRDLIAYEAEWKTEAEQDAEGTGVSAETVESPLCTLADDTARTIAADLNPNIAPLPVEAVGEAVTPAATPNTVKRRRKTEKKSDVQAGGAEDRIVRPDGEAYPGNLGTAAMQEHTAMVLQLPPRREPEA